MRTWPYDAHSGLAAIVDQVLDLGRQPTGSRCVPSVPSQGAGRQKHLAALGRWHARSKVRVFSDDGKCVSIPSSCVAPSNYVRGFDGVISSTARTPL